MSTADYFSGFKSGIEANGMLLRLVLKTIQERISQHEDNLRLWENGHLTPTEPDYEERIMVMERLKASIHALAEIEQIIISHLRRLKEPRAL